MIAWPGSSFHSRRWTACGKRDGERRSSLASASSATSTSPSISRGSSPGARTCSSGSSGRPGVDREAIRRLLDDVRAGRLDVDAAVGRLRSLPYQDLRVAQLDHHRALRGGAAEAVFCPGKTPEQVVAIVERLAVHHPNVLATRADADVAAAVAAAGLPHVYHRLPRLLV